MMESINQVMQRIAAIEQRFSHTQSRPAGDFAATLAAADAVQQSTAAKPSVSAGKEDIVKMINLAAGKYGVDPKLAMAVAEAESGLSPEAVSPVGAVGVMQLMPETARSLGVRNSKDPRENIDGGVRYLKQMLTTFGGDVSKAVAAYNAGPQAVKNYNGIPPYSETRNYVARVLSLAK
ncbi:putative murein lytic transglycosylase YjbJ [uncultured Sporomusa sp.]|uniref:Putative murein lytic transglycosylase YjbJ n=2 Tax=uncultured Sporomusa sp. TaxID=307249 RepID=A0A212LSF7_9FIRM|nr:putative murein lytic transglycosylase YjbJ [uncultured Sporomusa sp.]